MQNQSPSNDSHEGDLDAPPRAAEYVRMSTDQQRYSTAAQSEAIHRYADERGIQIVRRYEDAGKSGLNIKGRSALSQLISDVQNGKADYEVVIVYDVSRWGRFQDADESAYYEFICKQNGIQVEYCAEQFSNDGSPLSAVIKGIKRAMAGEYSRELSAKVFAGQTRLIRKGFRQGGRAGYGLRRTLLAEDGTVKCELKDGERKCLLLERVILTPGTPEELEIIAEIYRLFVSVGMTRQAIADDLNRRRIPFSEPGGWTRPRVSRVLTNVAYAGDSVWGRTSGKLTRHRVPTKPENWVYAPNVFKPIVERTLFNQAQAIVEAKVCKLTNAELLKLLAELLERHGTLSAVLIDKSPTLPVANVYRNRFGGLFGAYRRVGYDPRVDTSYVQVSRSLKPIGIAVLGWIVMGLEQNGLPFTRSSNPPALFVSERVGISVHVARCQILGSGNPRWQVRDIRRKATDLNVIVRMDERNASVQDYFILLRSGLSSDDFNVSARSEHRFAGAHFSDLSGLMQMLLPDEDGFELNHSPRNHQLEAVHAPTGGT